MRRVPALPSSAPLRASTARSHLPNPDNHQAAAIVRPPAVRAPTATYCEPRAAAALTVAPACANAAAPSAARHVRPSGENTTTGRGAPPLNPPTASHPLLPAATLVSAASPVRPNTAGAAPTARDQARPGGASQTPGWPFALPTATSRPGAAAIPVPPTSPNQSPRLLLSSHTAPAA